MRKAKWATLIGSSAILAAVIGCGGAGDAGPVGSSGGGGGALLTDHGTAQVDVNVATGAVKVSMLGQGPNQSRSLYTGSALSITSTPLSTDASEVTLKKLTLSIRNNTTDFISDPRLIIDKLVTDQGALDLREFSNVATIVGPGSGANDGPGPSVTISQPTGIARGGDGSLYLAGSGDGTLRRYTDGFVTRIATGIATPGGVAVSGSSVFMVEQSAHNLVRVPASGGSKFVMAGNGTPGLVDGSGASARFSSPRDIEIIGSTAFITDFANDRIRTATNLSGGSATVGTLNVFPVITGPSGLGRLTLGGVEWLVVTSTQTHKVHLVNSSNGQSFVIAGTGAASSVDGLGSTAAFNAPFDATVSNGAIYVSDLGGRLIRQLSLISGAQPQFASSWMVQTVAGAGSSGSADGPGNSAQFASPRFLATDGSGAVMAADLTNNRIRKVTPASGVFPVTGSGGGSGGTVSAVNPDGFIVDSGVLVGRKPYYDMDDFSKTDTVEHELEFAVTEGVKTFSFVLSISGVGTSSGILDAALNAGAPLIGSPNVNVRTLTGRSGSGFADGSPLAARFSTSCYPYVANGVVYVADFFNSAIRRFDPKTGLTTTIGGGLGLPAQNGSGLTAGTPNVISIWMNEAENEGYAALFNAHVVYRLTRANGSDPTKAASWNYSIIAGSPLNSGNVNGTGTDARFAQPSGVFADPSGSTVYLAALNNNQIRRLTVLSGVDRDDSDNWTVDTFAGSSAGTPGDDDGVGLNARFNGPRTLAQTKDGTLYVVEDSGNRIRRITPDRTVTLIAGAANGSSGEADGIGTAARFDIPSGIGVDNAGFAYVSDAGNQCVRRVNLSSFEVRTIAGNSSDPGDLDGSGATARLSLLSSGNFVPGFGLIVLSNGQIRLIERVVRNGQP